LLVAAVVVEMVMTTAVVAVVAAEWFLPVQLGLPPAQQT
jgi:hypothetical protein